MLCSRNCKNLLVFQFDFDFLKEKSTIVVISFTFSKFWNRPKMTKNISKNILCVSFSNVMICQNHGTTASHSFRCFCFYDFSSCLRNELRNELGFEGLSKYCSWMKEKTWNSNQNLSYNLPWAVDEQCPAVACFSEFNICGA